MKILIVEDNIKLAQSIKKGLEQEGYSVDILADGMDAERRVIGNPTAHDLLIFDVMLPGKNGLEICEELRIHKIVTPILMLTAKDTLTDKVLGFGAGTDDYLVKPFAFEELLARIRALMRRPHRITQPLLSIRGIVLDTFGRKVSAGGMEIILTAKELGVLEYLMNHAGVIVTREEVIAHVWEFSSNLMSNVIDVHIKNIRKKLGGEYGKHLETLRGVGYRFTL
jgi:DNA-binding response OmpR family regulator